MSVVLKLNRWIRIVAVCGAIGVVTNLLVFLLVTFLFAGPNGDIWVKWYFESHDGGYFLFATVLLALLPAPWVRRLK